MNADTKAVARELVAWFMSGNSVPVDIRHAAGSTGIGSWRMLSGWIVL